MTTIYTASATNNGFYLALAVAANSEDEARTAFEPLLSAPEDEGGDYTLSEDLEARIADEDGDYPNSGSMSMALDAGTAADLLANPGRVETLDSGANG